MMPVLLFSGISAVGIPSALAWIENINFLRYGIEVMVRNEFSGREFVCGDNSTSCTYATGEDVSGIHGLLTRTELTAMVQVIEIFNMDRLSIAENFLVMLGLLLFSRIAAVFFLSRASRNQS